jgi:hypothetical protein
MTKAFLRLCLATQKVFHQLLFDMPNYLLTNVNLDNGIKKDYLLTLPKQVILLSSICKSRNKLVPDNIEPKTIAAYYQLEGLSRRIVLSVNELELVFYVSYIKGKWYLTMVDHVTSDCSA